MYKCRLCSSKNIILKHRFNTFELGCCRKCGFVQVLQKPTIESLSEMYSGEYFNRGKYIESNKAINFENKRRLFWLKKSGLKKGARILDVGCATGDFINMAKRYFDMWGLDISEFAVKEARLKNPDIFQKIKKGMIEELSFPADFFDCIVMWDVIEHLWDPVGVISKLVKILKPGGVLAVSTPNINTATARLMGKSWHFMIIPEHLSFFNKSTLNYLFETAGLIPLKWMTRGKWVNFGFLLYKIKKAFPKLLPSSLIHWVQQKHIIANLALYVPTGDIQYASAIRRDKK
ncbi:hypothetical protein AMJ49_04950 [Parcubacteria bacterium DG_74_2]|nr:MAG: hypothetical protein AMJ49_04950 [Parcubacteria bacterium DG_74_2]